MGEPSPEAARCRTRQKKWRIREARSSRALAAGRSKAEEAGRRGFLFREEWRMDEIGIHGDDAPPGEESAAAGLAERRAASGPLAYPQGRATAPWT